MDERTFNKIANELVSVLMPVYNGEQFIASAIESILQQTYTNWELIIVNDGSTDQSEAIIRSFQDERIILHNNDQNRGIVFSRNVGLKHAKGTYLAFLDSDDIAIPNRLSEQVNYLNEHPKIGLLGSAVQLIDTNDTIINFAVDYPRGNHVIKVTMCFRNAFASSTIMCRKSALPNDGFNSNFPVAEDYDFWLRIAEKWEVDNLAEVLTKYRIHASNISKRKADLMIEMDENQLKTQLNLLGISTYSNHAFRCYFLLGKTDLELFYSEFLALDFVEVTKNLTALLDANIRTNYVDQQTLINWLFHFWSAHFYQLKNYHWSQFSSSSKSPFFKKLSIPIRLKFFIKCIIQFKQKS